MTPTTFHQPVILLIGKRRANQDEVDLWLAQSGYSIYEATNVFQALEQISDFTVGETPDVVFLHLDMKEAELKTLENMLLASEGDFHASVITYSSNESQRLTNHDTSGLGDLARQLKRLIPADPHVN
jgi:PleD family two-component response regulator